MSEENTAAENNSPEGCCDDFNGQIERLKEELAAAKDQTVRAHAEMQNIRRRAEQDVEKAHKFALDRFAGIYDNRTWRIDHNSWYR